MAAKTKKIPVASPVIKLAVSFLVLIGITTAWFISNKRSDVSPINVNVAKATTVSVSTGNGEWSQKLEYKEDNGAVISITEYSGNGKTLYAPVIAAKQVVGFALCDPDAANNGFVDFQLQLKADGPVDIYLSQGSAVTPEDLTTNLNADKISKNYIAGATRVALWCDDAQPQIWVPNTTYQFNSTTNQITTDGTADSVYEYATDETVENMVQISTNGTANGVAENGMFVWGDLAEISTEQLAPLMTLEPAEGTEEVKTLNVRVWVEGTDREAVKNFIGGKFKITLCFTAVPREGGEPDEA